VKNLSELLVKQKENRFEVYKRKYLQEEGSLPRTWWDNPAYSARDNGTRALVDLFGSEKGFDFPKAPGAVEDSLRVCSAEDAEIILDFFAGSGTTAHATINLNREDGARRKYILVEMADYFDSVILPRIKKLVFCDKWKDGKAAGGKGVSHLLKYYQMEQYEDALRRLRYDDADLFDDPNQDPYHQYVFLRDLKMLEALDVDLKKNKVKVDLSKLYHGIDIAETLSNLTGKWIKRITADSVEFQDGEVVDTKNLDWRRIKPLIWW
jgi:adenine-specific DNA-methyltransferase